MGERSGSVQSPILPVGMTSSRLVVPDGVSAEVVNLYPTEEGTLRSVYLPLPILPASNGGPPNSGDYADPDAFQYGPTKGIFHCTIRNGERDILLLYTGNQVWEFRGWERGWHALLGPASVSPDIELILPTATSETAPIQFVGTPRGVVIIPPECRAYFYDGELILPLGFDEPPAPPQGVGPESSRNTFQQVVGFDPADCGVNDVGYAHDAVTFTRTQMPPVFKFGRLGTVDTPSALEAGTSFSEDAARVHTAGYLSPGRYRAVVQLVGPWGDLSPVSGPSDEIKFDRQPSIFGAPSNLPNYDWTRWGSVDIVRKQVAWIVPKGPVGVVGRILGRTKDLENSGDAAFYEVPLDASSHVRAIATLPDNITEMYPDNIPDAWLYNRMLEVDPVPMFRFAALAMGRLVIANFRGDPGAVRVSEPGRFGTFTKGGLLYPDPNGAGITAVYGVANGALIFTETSCFLLTVDDSGQNFRAVPVSSTVGCVAPSSIATMRNGLVIWLGRDGFYGWAGGEISYLFDAHREQARRFNRGRMHDARGCFDSQSGQYHCYVAVEGSTANNRRFKYDGNDWHWDDFDGLFRCTGVTVTRDHRQLQIACGKLGNDDGVWIMDHGGAPVTGRIESGWVRAQSSDRRASAVRVAVWLRETRDSGGVAAEKVRVSVRKDYRAEETSYDVIETHVPIHESYTSGPGRQPTFWGGPLLIGDPLAKFRRRRLFWANADIHVRAGEVFKVVVSCPEKMEIAGFRFETIPLSDGGARRP